MIHIFYLVLLVISGLSATEAYGGSDSCYYKVATNYTVEDVLNACGQPTYEIEINSTLVGAVVNPGGSVSGGQIIRSFKWIYKEDGWTTTLYFRGDKLKKKDLGP